MSSPEIDLDPHEAAQISERLDELAEELEAMQERFREVEEDSDVHHYIPAEPGAAARLLRRLRSDLE